MSEEIMDIDGLININLKEGILILHESELITVGLVVSKSSKQLRDLVEKFSHEFEKKFKKQIRESFRDISIFESAIELIEKYFSNFPSRIIRIVFGISKLNLGFGSVRVRGIQRVSIDTDLIYIGWNLGILYS
jgi:hypothetical protein